MADLLLDENATAQTPRPGTSLARPGTSRSGPNAGVRPTTQGGRPVTGFARPGTGAGRPGTKSRGGDVSIESALRGGRPGTSRPVTSGGRAVRVGTASMLAEPGGPFVDLEKLDLRKYAARPALTRALCDYMLYHDRNPRKAVELCSLATTRASFKDWWWKERLGKSYYQLGLLRDAEKQFKSSLNDCPTVTATNQLAKVHIRHDQPFAAVAVYEKGAAQFPGELSMILGQARICDALGELDEGVELYKQALRWDASNVEAVACLASHHFYGDQPEMALRHYRRLLQMGVNTCELWNNVGLCCFFASQYDMTLHCFDRALALATDDSMADVWFNVGHVAIGVGDLDMAHQAFEIALGVESTHAESFNNLGVLESRRGNVESARANFAAAAANAEWAHEPFYNHALIAFRRGDFQEAFERVEKALEAFPEHAEGLELKKQLVKQFTVL